MKSFTRCKRKKKKRTRQSKKYKGGMKTRKSKHVRFGVPVVTEFESSNMDEESSLDNYPPCPSFKHIRGHHFPCRYKNTIFENQREFGEWYLEEIKRTINKKKEKDSHMKRIKSEQLSETGNWNRFMAPEFRNYTEEGLIEHVLPFSQLPDEESEMLLKEKRKERNLLKRDWLDDVKNFRKGITEGDDINAKNPGTI